MAAISLFQQTNMAAVTSCTMLFNMNKIQYGHRFFVSTDQYGGRDVMLKATSILITSSMATVSFVY